jgi:hypothetical protein
MKCCYTIFFGKRSDIIIVETAVINIAAYVNKPIFHPEM